MAAHLDVRESDRGLPVTSMRFQVRIVPVRWARPRWSAADEAERVSHRIEVDPEATVLRGLMGVHSGTRGHDRGLGRGNVGYRQVQVQLLWVGAPRPGGLDPVIDALKRQRRAAVRILGGEPTARRNKRGEVLIRTLLDLPSEDFCVEPAECQGVGTIEDDKVKLGFGLGRVVHAVTVAGSLDNGGVLEARSRIGIDDAEPVALGIGQHVVSPFRSAQVLVEVGHRTRRAGPHRADVP